MPTIIPVSQAAPLLTTAIAARFDEMKDINVNNFARSFFKEETSPVRYPVIDVRRGSEKVAIDVMRGDLGNRIQITKSTQKAFDPFYYKQFFDATQLEVYFKVFGSQSFNINDMAELANGVAVENKAMTDMIERGIELHCMSALLTGVVTSLRDNTTIDFKRKAESLVDLGAGQYWDVSGVNPFTQLKEKAGDFIKTEGKSNGYVMNVICGTAAWQAFRNNDVVKDRLKEFNNKRDLVAPAQLQANGGIYQGEVDCDSYMMRFYTCNDVYDDPTTGISTPYMDPKKVIVIAENAKFDLIYAAIPQVRAKGINTSSLTVGKFIYKDFANEEAGYHRFYVESSPLPVLTSVNRVVTLTVLGA